MGNVRVAIQQPTAYARAAMVLPLQDMVKGLTKNPLKGVKKAMKNSAIANWKSLGYYETSMGQSMKAVITGQQSLADNLKDKGGVLAQKGDEITWGALWNACENNISRTNPELDVNSKEFTEKVTSLFDDVIDQTQVVDTVFHRSQFLRSANTLAKIEGAFMTEPHKSYNMMYRAVHQAQQGGKEGKKYLAKAVTVSVANAMLTSLAASLVSAWRDDDFEKEFKDKYWENVKEGFIGNVNPLTWIPYVKDVISLMEGYDLERMDTAAMTKLVQSIQQAFKTNSKKTPYGKIKPLVQSLSMCTGIPAYNLLREIETLVENVTQEPWLESKNSNGTQYKRLIKYRKEGNTDKFDKVYDELTDSGMEEKKIRSGVRSTINRMFKNGELTEDEAAEALRSWDYDDVYDIIDKWKENMEK